MIDAVARSLTLITEATPPDTIALAAALDELACIYQSTPHRALSSVDLEPPPGDYQGLRAILALRFPTLGYYAATGPLALDPREELTGDAIDDLADIVLELRETLWRHENLGEADALWHFRWSFEHHWGYHLRSVQRYLHAVHFGL